MMSETDIMKMKVADLKRELKLRGLSATGNKTELQERLQTALIDGDFSLEDAAISEDLLDEDVLTDEEKVLESTQEDSTSLTSNKISEEKRQAESTPQNKKVVIKRKTSITNPSSINTNTTNGTSAKENSAPIKLQRIDIENNKPTCSKNISNSSLNTDNKKCVKISELSMKERLEMRAKKFAIDGIDTSNSGKINIESSNNDKETQLMQTLKRRAERFGCVVSPKIAEIEKEERIKKRQERFGPIVINNSAKQNIKDLKNAYEEKKRQRLERFKDK